MVARHLAAAERDGAVAPERRDRGHERERVAARLRERGRERAAVLPADALPPALEARAEGGALELGQGRGVEPGVGHGEQRGGRGRPAARRHPGRESAPTSKWRVNNEFGERPECDLKSACRC